MAKYCESCNQLCEDDTARFCPSCGSPSLRPAATQAPSENVASPVSDNPRPAPAMPPVNTDFAQKPKKKSGRKKAVAAIVAICLVLALVVGIFSYSGAFAQLFKSDKGYFSYVEKKSVADFCDSFEEYYDGYLFDNILKDSKHNIKMSFDFSDDFINGLLGDEGQSVDLKWINGTAMDLTVNTSGLELSADSLISIDGQNVLSVVLFADREDSKLLLKLKEITDDVLQFDMEESADLSESGFDTQLISQFLPKSSVVTKLITKYHGIVLDRIEKVEKTKEEVSLDGITEKMTVLTCTLTEKNVKDISLEILRELKSDAEIKKIFKDAQEALEDNEIDFAEEDLYDAFLEGIDEEIEELSNEESGDEIAVVIKDYVNSDNEIVGRKIGENGEMLDYLKVESKGQYAKYADLKDGTLYREAGTKKGDRVTAECVFTENDETLYKMNLTDFDIKAFKKGKLDGKIRLIPSGESVKDAAPEELQRYSALLDMSFDIDIKGDSDSGECTLAVLNGEKALFKTNAKYTVTSGKGVTEPEGKVVEIDGLDSLYELLGDLHLDQLVSNLRKTSVPKDYVDAIEEISNQLNGNF